MEISPGWGSPALGDISDQLAAAPIGRRHYAVKKHMEMGGCSSVIQLTEKKERRGKKQQIMLNK